MKENESDQEDSDKKKWDILRDDYMMGAKMKDWDKESDSENPQSDNEMDSGSDSGWQILCYRFYNKSHLFYKGFLMSVSWNVPKIILCYIGYEKRNRKQMAYFF